jgi:hypothetical protein
MKITAPYFLKKPKEYYTAEVKLKQTTDPMSMGTQKTAVIEFNGSKFATLYVDEKGNTRIRIHQALNYLTLDSGVTIKPIVEGDLSHFEMDQN